jgi:hypothetical protein
MLANEVLVPLFWSCLLTTLPFAPAFGLGTNFAVLMARKE